MNANQLPFRDENLIAIAKRAFGVLETAIEAGVAGSVRGDEFPLPEDPQALENKTAALVNLLPEDRRTRLATSVLNSIAERSNGRQHELGDIGRLDPRSRVPIETQARNLPRLRINPRRLHASGRRAPGQPNDSVQPRNFQAENDFVVLEAIETKYRELGGMDGPLGRPLAPVSFEKDRKGRGVRVRRFEKGIIVQGPKAEAFAVLGSTYNRYKADGEIKSRYGVPITDTTESTRGGNVTDFYDGYSLYWSRETGVREVHGAIRGRYRKLGGEKGVAGYPTSDELEIPDIPGGKFHKFNGGEMHWHPTYGAHFLPTRILEARRSAKMLAYPNTVPVAIPTQHPNNIFGMLYRFEGGLIQSLDPTGLVPMGQPRLPLTRVQLVLRQVKVLRMPAAEPLKAELLVGGSRVDPDGDVKSTSTVNLGSFRKGRGQTRNFERVLAEYDLKSSVIAWPASVAFVVGFIENEQLAGSSTDFLNDVAAALRVEVDKLIAGEIEDLEKKIDEQFLGPIVGQVLSEIAGWVLDRIWEKLEQLWKDDPCKPVAISLRVPDPFAVAGPEGKVIETEVFETTGVDKIRLRATCEWRVA